MMKEELEPQPKNTIVDRLCEEIYDMEEIIGEGTFSSVVRANHNDTSKSFAIKIIDKTKIENDKQLSRIYNEINIHREAKHPYIVRYEEHYETEIDVCIVMELCQGGELFDRIVAKGSFCEREASTTLRQILKAVEYLHTQGIVHRDIKPENLIYAQTKNGEVIKLGDFGLAKRLESTSGRGMLTASLSGTPAYCAPERLGMDAESKSVDMWSIGCILYFLLFGVPPFYSEKEDEDENEDEIFDRVLSFEGNLKFPENSNVSDSAKDLIIRLLERDPQKRLSAEQCLKHSWIKGYQTLPETDTSSASASNPNDSERQNLKQNMKQNINRIIDEVDKVREKSIVDASDDDASVERK